MRLPAWTGAFDFDMRLSDFEAGYRGGRGLAAMGKWWVGGSEMGGFGRNGWLCAGRTRAGWVWNVGNGWRTCSAFGRVRLNFFEVPVNECVVKSSTTMGGGEGGKMDGMRKNF